MAQWRPMSYKIKQSITNLGDGINTGVPALSIKDSEMSYLREMDSKDYPALSVRPGRYVRNFAQSTNIRGFYQPQPGLYMAIVNDNALQAMLVNGSVYVGSTAPISTSLSTAVNADGNFTDLTINSTSYTIYANSSQRVYWPGGEFATTALSISDTNCPQSGNVITTHKNRIFMASGNLLSFSALNSITDWTTANDAGNIRLNGVFRIMALTEYNNYLVIFGLRSMHILYGSGPETFEIVDLENTVGAISHRGVTKCNGKLYWVALDGIYEYDGSVPKRISDPIKQYVDNLNIAIEPVLGLPTDVAKRCSADRHSKYVYFTVPYNGSTSNNLILKFDTERRVWLVEEGNFYILKHVNEMLLGVNYNGNILDMRSTNVNDKLTTGGSETPISWNFITKPFIDDSIGGVKTLSDIDVIASISTASTSFSIGYSTNIENNDSTTFKGSTIAGSSDPYVLFTTNAGSSNTQARRIQIPANKLQNIPWYRLRFGGSGPATVNFIEKSIRIKRR